MAAPIPALYRERMGEPWSDAEIVGRHWPSGAFILREIDKAWPGVWLGWPDQVRIPGRVFELREPFGGVARVA